MKERRQDLDDDILVDREAKKMRLMHIDEAHPCERTMPGGLSAMSARERNGERWNFSLQRERERTRDIVQQIKPSFIVGAGRCKPFDIAVQANQSEHDSVEFKQAMRAIMVHLEFWCDMYEVQLLHGCYFTHEHPIAVASCRAKGAARTASTPGVSACIIDLSLVSSRCVPQTPDMSRDACSKDVPMHTVTCKLPDGPRMKDATIPSRGTEISLRDFENKGGRIVAGWLRL